MLAAHERRILDIHRTIMDVKSWADFLALSDAVQRQVKTINAGKGRRKSRQERARMTPQVSLELDTRSPVGGKFGLGFFDCPTDKRWD